MIVWAIFKRLLVRAILFLLDHKVSSLTIAVLLGVVVWLYYTRPPAPSETVLAVQPLLTPAPAVKNYVKGTISYNAHLVWDSMNDDMIKVATDRDISVDDLQALFDLYKEQGMVYENAAYIGGYVLQSGETIYFYMVARRLPNSEELDEYPMVFIVDSSGKIAGMMEWPRYEEQATPTSR